MSSYCTEGVNLISHRERGATKDKKLVTIGSSLLTGGAVLAAFLGGLSPSIAADLTARQLTERLFRADPATPPDLSNLDLRELDMSGLNFKGAKLKGSDLFGADLSGADLSKTDLSDARLDRVILIGARLDGANLARVTILRPSAFSSLSATVDEASSFAGADLREAMILGRFNYANLSGANLTGATLAPRNQTGFIEHIWRTELEGADLSGATLADADLSYTLLRFSNLRGANLAGALFKSADLTRADLTGANLAGADFSDADLYGANLTNVLGLGTAGGMESARNFDKAIR